MKTLAVVALALMLVACGKKVDGPIDRSYQKDYKKVCVEGISYIVFHASGMGSVQVDATGKIITCAE